MKTYNQFNESKEIDRNGYTIFFKIYYSFDTLYDNINLLDYHKISYDILYYKKFVKIEAYAANVDEYKIMFSIDYKIDRNILDNDNNIAKDIDKIRNIVQDGVWKLTTIEELPYLKDINKFNL